MKPDQERIYFLIADSLEAARSSPYIEQLKEHGLEVLLLSERVDEWVMDQLDEFEGKKFKNASRGDLELGKLENEEEKKKHEEATKESEGLIKRIKDALAERVEDVRTSVRPARITGNSCAERARHGREHAAQLWRRRARRCLSRSPRWKSTRVIRS